MLSPRRLTGDDVEDYIAFRHEMLLDSPRAFTSSPEDDRGKDAAELHRTAADPERAIWLIRDDASAHRILAAAGVMRETKIKRRHVAFIWGVYVTPSARGRGLARRVVTAAIDSARGWPGVSSVRLTVNETADAAHHLYGSLGFLVWGVEPDALRLGGGVGRSYFERHMHLPLTESSANP
jgi:ribosomal protein S18 acetylase RimI-like enzyme